MAGPSQVRPLGGCLGMCYKVKKGMHVRTLSFWSFYR
jgi:hypothetical protein